MPFDTAGWNKIVINLMQMNMAVNHDRVISELIPKLNQEKFDIYTNPNQEKNAGIGDNYPDIIMTEKDGRTVKFILEVETVDSVTSEESVKQWKKYFTEISATFYLVVPVTLLNKAKELCQKEDINARYTTYFEKNGELIFDFQ